MTEERLAEIEKGLINVARLLGLVQFHVHNNEVYQEIQKLQQNLWTNIAELELIAKYGTAHTEQKK